MNRKEFDTFCGQLKAVTNVVQWGNSSVWKTGGKIFAICSYWGEGDADRISFKCSDLSYLILIEQEGIIPAPYLARAKWVQLQTPDALGDEEIKSCISEAYSIVSSKLSKAVRNKLGLL